MHSQGLTLDQGFVPGTGHLLRLQDWLRRLLALVDEVEHGDPPVEDAHQAHVVHQHREAVRLLRRPAGDKKGAGTFEEVCRYRKGYRGQRTFNNTNFLMNKGDHDSVSFQELPYAVHRLMYKGEFYLNGIKYVIPIQHLGKLYFSL